MHALLMLLADQLEGTRLAIFTQLIREGGAAGRLRYTAAIASNARYQGFSRFPRVCDPAMIGQRVNA